MASRAGKIVRNVLLGLVGGLALLLVIVQIALSDKVLTRIVNRIAAQFVEGTVRFDQVHASVLKSFPYLNVTASGLEVTYPHDKFAAYDLDGVEGEDFLLRAGRGETVDTLLSVSSLSASIDYISAFKGQYHLRHATLSRPRIFAHSYDSTTANWHILRFLHSDDTTSSSLPPLTVRKISLDRRPHIVYTDPADTLFGLITLHSLDFQGNVLVDDLLSSEVDLKADSLFVAGRIPADTVAVRLSHLGVKGDRDDLRVEAAADAFLATGSHGRMRIPVALKAQGALPERGDKVLEVRVDKLGLDVSTLSLEGNGDVVLYPGRPYIRAEAEVDDASVNALAQSFGDNFPVLKKIRTDAKVSLTALCDGYYDKETRSLPELVAEVVIPEAHLSYEGFPYDGYVSLLAEAETDTEGQLDADIQELMIDALGVELMAAGTVTDALGPDPAIKADGFFDTDVKALTDLFTRQRGITGRGDISGDLSVKALLSQILDLSQVGNAAASAHLDFRKLHVDDVPDTLTVEVNKAAAALAIKGNSIDDSMRKGARVLSLDAKFDTLDVTYRDNIYVRGGNLKLQAQNSAAILKGGRSLTPFMGVLSGDAISLRDASDLSLEILGNRETFRVTPATKASPSPVLSLTSSSRSVVARKDVNRVALDALEFNASASRAAAKSGNRQRMARRLDSLQRVYPGVPRDSLLRHAYASRRRPVWLTDKSFAEKDIHIKLDKSLASYVQDWDFAGNLTLGSGLVITPYFPLDTRISDVSGSFNNDRIALSNIFVNAGESDISANATLSGLRRALTSGRGRLSLVADVNSDYIDANELMRGYASGSRYEPTRYDKALNEGLGSDEVYRQKVGETVVPDSVARSSLIVIPSNLEAEITLNANRIRYDSLLVTWAASDIAMKQRCLQVTNTVATSNMGDIYFEGFYSTQTRKDIRVGFDLNMVDITAEKVITLFPALDTIVPMLKSFAGLLDCELAATADMDEKMNIKLPTIDGVMRVSGKDLSLRDSEQFTKIAKVLMFKNKQEARVDKIGVTGIVRDNTLEIFPFVMKVDRYTVAASGIQHLDKSYKYHLSVLRSPLLVRFGLNIFGDNFDEMKYRLGKAKYKNTQVPVFTKQLDTVQYSLINSIHNIFEKGVEKAIRENQEQQIVQDRMKALDYSMDAEVDTLTRVQLDSLRMMQDSLSVQDRVAEKIDTLRAQERDADVFEEESPGSLRQSTRAGKKAERQVEKAVRKQQRQQKKAAARKPDE
jgi:hypothetical protein